MKICIKCNENFNEDYNFCPYCGEEIHNDSDNIDDTNQISIYDLMENEEKIQCSVEEIDPNNIEDNEEINESLDAKNSIKLINNDNIIIKMIKALNIKKIAALVVVLLLTTITVCVATILRTPTELGVQIKSINLQQYPNVQVELKKTTNKNLISKDNIAIYDSNKELHNFDIVETKDGWNITFTSDKTDTDVSTKEIKIENKKNTDDSVSKSYEINNDENKNVYVNVNTNNSLDSKDNIIDTEEYINLQASIKNIVTKNFSNITSNYSLAFKDLSQKSTLSINSEKTISASTIKIYIMIETFNQIKSGNINLDDTVILEESMKTDGSGMLSSKATGEKFTINELITLMMIKSDNTAANILIDKIGMESINNCIKNLGCKDTELNRKMMDATAIEKGVENYTSVDDLCLTLEKLYNKQCIDEYYDNLMLDIMKKNENHTKIPKLLPDTLSIANKSGEYTGVENDAAIITTDKGAYVLCITTSNGGSGSQIKTINNISKDIYNKFME
ncbi:serine hydrolase [Clostridium bornimense]|uniref:serine hydrolase n=1 Tax=Clostridium bornimense TaxID=1216932 RepID=UPI0006888D76|nr:serine hydrolase [Clostridium bornimense]